MNRRGFMGLLGLGAVAAVGINEAAKSAPEWVDAPRKPLVPYAPPKRVDIHYGHGLVYDVANDRMVKGRNSLLTMADINKQALKTLHANLRFTR